MRKTRKTRTALAVVSLLLLCVMAVNLTGCRASVKAASLMDGVTPNRVTPLGELDGGAVDVTDFAIRLLEKTYADGENTLVSPLSVMCALAMLANGAEGETREQMESLLGMSVSELNLYLYSYLSHLPQGEKYKLNVANSIWFKDDDRLTVNPAFLQTNADYYGADIYKTSFDEQTLKDINGWVKDETDGMIPEVLKEIPEEAIMYLVNALSFEAEWASVYEKAQVKDGTFTKEDGTEQDVELMYSGEFMYIEDGNATGFIKEYSGGKYAFAALLPNEGVSVCEYIESLDGASLNGILSEAEYRSVMTAIPKFKTDYSVELSKILQSMGMIYAFAPDLADLDGLGEWRDGEILVGQVLHKTYIEVGEKGTRAGAVTVVEADGGSGAPDEIKEVYLDRPFVYMLIDCETNIPFFIGTVMDVD